MNHAVFCYLASYQTGILEGQVLISDWLDAYVQVLTRKAASEDRQVYSCALH